MDNFADTFKHINELTNFLRTPKARASFHHFQQQNINLPDGKKPKDPMDKDQNTAINPSTSTDKMDKTDIHQKHKEKILKNATKERNKRKQQKKPKKKRHKPSYFESKGMKFNNQDASHAMVTVMNSLFEKSDDRTINNVLSMDEVFNNIIFAENYNKHYKLNFTQYKLKQHKYCYGCYKITPCKIVKCRKCKLVTYCSKKCEISNKKYHSYSCSVINTSEIRKIANLSSVKCMDKIEENIRNPSSKLIFYLKRMQYILKYGENQNKTTLSQTDIGLKLHALSRIYNACFVKYLWIQYINTLWSCYGIPEFLLNTPFIRNKRFQVYNKYGFPPNYTKLSNDCKDYDIYYKYHTNMNELCDIYYLSFFISNILGNSITDEGCIPFIQSPQSCYWVFHKSKFLSINDIPMFNVVCKRILEIWTDIHVNSDCGDSLASLSNIIEKFLSINNGEMIYKIMKCNFEYIVSNTTFIDCCISEMTTGAHKRAPTVIFEYIVNNFNDKIVCNLWKNNKYLVTYYILLIDDTIPTLKEYINENESKKEDEHNVKHTKKQLKYAKVFIDNLLPKCIGNKIMYQLKYLSKYILLNHYQQPRSDTIDEYRITMPFYTSFIKFNNIHYNHYSFDYIINNVFFWNFVYFFLSKYYLYELWAVMKYLSKNNKEKGTIIEALHVVWSSIKYDNLDKNDKQQCRKYKVLTFIFSKCIHKNHSFEENYNFWMRMKTTSASKKLKDDDTKHKYIKKICGNPICSMTHRKIKRINNGKFRRCSKCKIYYCNRKCQKIHWKYGHKTYCFNK